MLKLLFVHRGPIYRDSCGKYSEYGYHGLSERYSYLADDITFLMEVCPLNGSAKQTYLDEKVNVVEVPNLTRLRTYRNDYVRARDIIKNEVENTDVAILRQSAYAKIAAIYCRKYHKPYIYENVSCPWDALWNYGWKGKAIAPIKYISERCMNMQAEYVQYVTDKFLQKRYPTKGKGIGCSDVMINPMDDEGRKNRSGRLKTIGAGRKIIMGTAAAVDVPYKGQKYVIEALKRLLLYGYNIEYRLAGSNRKNNPYLQEYARKMGVENNVKFCGSLSNDEIFDFYDHIDIYIQPSKQEGLSRAIIEAMSRGCPVIASNVGGNSELLDQKFLFKRGKSDAIVEAVIWLLNQDLKTISNINMQRAMKYRMDVVERRRRKFYDDFIAHYGINKGSIH